MKNIIFSFLFLFTTNFGFAQFINIVTIEARVLNAETKVAVPYVNIGFVGKSIGTVSDTEGNFRLEYDEDLIGNTDILQISSLGYETIQTNKTQLERLLTNSNVIYLKPKIEQIDEVVLNAEGRVSFEQGSTDNDGTGLGYWKEKNALGGEIATVFRIKEKNSQIDKLKFNVVENQSDSLKIRVNVYDYRRGYPSYLISKENIYKTVKTKNGIVEVDLSDYNIHVSRDCVVAIELIEVYGDVIEFALSGRDYGGVSFKRYVSQDNWERISRIGMNFMIEGTEPPQRSKEGYVLRSLPQKIKVFYDASLSMANRRIGEELDLLKAYLKEVKDAELELIPFSTYAMPSMKFEIKNGRNSALFDSIQAIKYNGLKSFEDLLKPSDFDAEVALVFSDGESGIDEINSSLGIPVFTINSMDNANHYVLQHLSDYTEGHYVDLSKLSTKEALKLMTTEVPDTRVFSLKPGSRDKVKGRIFMVTGPAQGATVQLKNSFIETQSDENGEFEISAEEGDILIGSYLGMKDSEVKILNKNSVAILLKPDGEILDEVLLKGESKQEETEIEGSMGKRKERSLGYAADMITYEEIGTQYNTLAQLIAGKFPGVQVVGLDVGYQTPQFLIRGGGGSLTTAYALFDVDGIIYSPDQDIPPLNLQNIESITILRSLAATNRYGTLGRGGAIVIKTRFTGIDEVEERPSAEIIGNDYKDEGVLLLEAVETDIPSFVKELEESNSFEEAKKRYYELLSYESNRNISFFLKSFDYFLRWDKDFAFSVLSNIMVIAAENAKALKTLAFKYEELGRNAEAELAYKKLVEIRPNHEQAYRDLARIYVINGKYTEAMNLYKRMLVNDINNIEFVGLQKTIENELMHLLAFHREKVVYKDLPMDMRSANFKFDLRLVFEWNDPSAEFDIQFVNPKKRYFPWSHTLLASPDRLKDEVAYGYNTEEFIIDDAEPGEWLVNVRYFGKEENRNPTFLKYTIFKNYGLPNETKEIKVINMDQLKEKVTIDKFYYSKLN